MSTMMKTRVPGVHAAGSSAVATGALVRELEEVLAGLITEHEGLTALARAQRGAIGAADGAGLERITAEEAPPAPRSVSLRLDVHDLALSGLRDDVEEGAGKAAELERLGRIIAQCDKTIAATQARLNNPGYAQKAPAKLVEETKAQLAKAISEREAAARELERLS